MREVKLKRSAIRHLKSLHSDEYNRTGNNFEFLLLKKGARDNKF